MTDISGIGKSQGILAPESHNLVSKPVTWGRHSVTARNEKNRLPPPPPGGIVARTQSYKLLNNYKVQRHSSRLIQKQGISVSIKKQVKQAIRQIQNKGLSHSKAKKQSQALVKKAKVLEKRSQDNQPDHTRLKAKFRPAASASAMKSNTTSTATGPLVAPVPKRQAPPAPSSANTHADRAPLKPARPAPPPPGKINTEAGNTRTPQKPAAPPPPPAINREGGNSRKTQSLPKKRKAPAPPPPAPPPPPLGGKSVQKKQVGSPSIAGDIPEASPKTVKTSPDTRSILLNEIEKGIQLKPVWERKNNTPTKKATEPSDLKSALIEEIKKGGNKLKKVEQEKPSSPEMNPFHRELLAAMEKRRDAIAPKEEEWSKNDESESGNRDWDE